MTIKTSSPYSNRPCCVFFISFTFDYIATPDIRTSMNEITHPHLMLKKHFPLYIIVTYCITIPRGIGNLLELKFQNDFMCYNYTLFCLLPNSLLLNLHSVKMDADLQQRFSTEGGHMRTKPIP